ncbi:MAG: hypothetical protein JWM35_840 [Verrucomicrobia bacterium]|nr:hypothetical protein [Verrucomicrobiota bacterium]
MILFLRGLFIVVIASMLWVTSWASMQCPLFAIPREVYGHPWFIATMFDAYWGFITFFVWVCYRQVSWVARIAWFVAIILFGNIAMASYCLDALFRVRKDAKLSEVLVTKSTGIGGLGIFLALLGIAVTLAGIPRH